MSFLDMFSGGIIAMIIHAGPIAKAVMAILLFFSVVSWTIIFFKIRQFNQMERDGNRIITLLEEADSFKKLVGALRSMDDSPYYKIILSVYKALSTFSRENPVLDKNGILDLQRKLRIFAQEENERIEKYLSFLATTANTAPFVGLFGTVWGIMESFREIGLRGTTSLAVVAPGISEALIATAFGLATAIPAVVGYNYLLGRSKKISNRLDSIINHVLELLEK
ncbi:MAG: MotA/TolQ/ExbB proton channel family protein [Deltaproteobacteria bacterium]|nr:MotA/TolQ/ExbB proton channel family protein [Deltaproteobacteria bacterium]